MSEKSPKVCSAAALQAIRLTIKDIIGLTFYKDLGKSAVAMYADQQCGREVYLSVLRWDWVRALYQWLDHLRW